MKKLLLLLALTGILTSCNIINSGGGPIIDPPVEDVDYILGDLSDYMIKNTYFYYNVSNIQNSWLYPIYFYSDPMYYSNNILIITNTNGVVYSEWHLEYKLPTGTNTNFGPSNAWFQQGQKIFWTTDYYHVVEINDISQSICSNMLPWWMLMMGSISSIVDYTNLIVQSNFTSGQNYQIFTNQFYPITNLNSIVYTNVLKMSWIKKDCRHSIITNTHYSNSTYLSNSITHQYFTNMNYTIYYMVKHLGPVIIHEYKEDILNNQKEEAVLFLTNHNSL